MEATKGRKLAAGETARRLRISVQRLHQLAKEGKIEFETTALGRLYAPDEVERLRRERAERAERSDAS